MDFGLKKSKKKLSEEVAHDQVMILLDYYGIDVEDYEDQKSKEATISTLNKIVGYVRDGLIEISLDKGSLVITQTLAKPSGDDSTITYSEVRGANKAAMDGKGEDHNYAKVYALVGSLTSLGETAIKKLTGKDLSVAECLGTIFLAV